MFDSLRPLDCSTPGFFVLHYFISQSLLKLKSIESVMLSNHVILGCPLLILPSIFLSIRVFSKQLALCIRWPKYGVIAKSYFHLFLPRFCNFWREINWDKKTASLLHPEGTTHGLLWPHAQTWAGWAVASSWLWWRLQGLWLRSAVQGGVKMHEKEISKLHTKGRNASVNTEKRAPDWNSLITVLDSFQNQH